MKIVKRMISRKIILKTYNISLIFFLTLIINLGPSNAEAKKEGLNNNCKKFFTGKSISSTLNYMKVEKGQRVLVKAPEGKEIQEILGSLKTDIEISKEFKKDLRMVINQTGSKRTTHKVAKRIYTDASAALRAHEILENKKPIGNRELGIISFSLIKRITTITEQQRYTASLVDSILEKSYELISRNNGDQIFFQNWKTTQFTTDKTEKYLEDNLLIPLREHIFNSLKDDYKIVEAFGGTDNLEKAIKKKLSLGLNHTHVGTSIASRIAALRDDGKIVRYNRKNLLETLRKAYDLHSQIPEVFKRSGFLKEEIIVAFRKASEKSVGEISYHIPKNEIDLKKALTEENIDLISNHLDHVNILDYIPPQPMPKGTARRIIALLKQGIISRAAKLYEQNPTKVQRKLQGSIKGKKFIMLFDHKGLGTENYYLIMKKLPKLLDILESDSNLGIEETSIIFRKFVKNILQNSAREIRKNAAIIRDVLKDRGESFEIFVEGDEIYVLLDKKEGASKTMEKILETTGGHLRGSGVSITPQTPTQNVLLQLDEQTAIIKHIEGKTNSDFYLIGLEGHNFAVPLNKKDMNKIKNILKNYH